MAKELREQKDPKETEKRGKRSERRGPRAKLVMARGKRKTAIARAVIKPGKGRFTVNRFGINTVSPQVFRDTMSEPLSFMEPSVAEAIDISVSVRGGGVAGQAQAARTAVARALVEFTKDESLRKRMADYDRTLLVEDSRRVEPKKFKGPKARARFTKSYR